MNDAVAGVSMRINNAGTITGQPAIASFETPLVLSNRGVVESVSGLPATHLVGPSANDVIQKIGLIDGAVNLGGGDDFFTDVGGRTLGRMFGGSGDDT